MDKTKLKKLFGFIMWASLIIVVISFFVGCYKYGESLRLERECLNNGKFFCDQYKYESSGAWVNWVIVAIVSGVLRWLIKDDKKEEKNNKHSEK